MDVPFKKRAFDVAICVVTVWLWLPVLALCALLNFILNGRPVFYVSKRRIDSLRVVPIVKFRAMIRNAALVANRDTVPVRGKIFFNIPPDSALYTRLGRIFEKCCLTELPQVLHVLNGQMSIIGNRPLPENVTSKLQSRYPYARDRFLVKGGLTGPVQLVGRDRLSDADRLRLEIRYCKLCAESYSTTLDLLILLNTVLIGARLREPLSLAQVEHLMERHSGYDLARWWDVYISKQRVRPQPAPVMVSSEQRGVPVPIVALSAARAQASLDDAASVPIAEPELSET
jgi:lipopolysaccharide/colanic/teichoic acid biosynthesis glycosyltransferase